MGRPENYLIGTEGEERVKAFLYEHGCEIEETGEPNGYPDFFFRRDGTRWGAECKTMRGVHRAGKVGMVKISKAEYWGVTHLREEGVEPCLIVEVRPRGATADKYAYLFVPWEKVGKRFERSKPKLLSLSLWWVLKNGVNLEWWLNE